MEHDFNLDSFIQRLFQMKQAAGKRKLVQARAHLAAAVQAEKPQYCAGELYSRGATGPFDLFRSGHDPSHYDIRDR